MLHKFLTVGVKANKEQRLGCLEKDVGSFVARQMKILKEI